MARNYIALIRKEADSDFGVEFPDMPGCVTAGSTLDEAAAMAREALALHLEGLVEEGEAVPEAISLEEVTTLAASAGAVPILVPAPRLKSRAVRINITVDETLLAEIDEAAGPGERSAFLAHAARSALQAPETATENAPMHFQRAKVKRRRTVKKKAPGKKVVVAKKKVATKKATKRLVARRRNAPTKAKRR